MTAAVTQSPALRYHGGKFRLAHWIMGFFPEHMCYVEPFGGAAGVMLQKPRAYAEVYNDLDGEIVNFFRVIQNPFTRHKLIEACLLTPYAREEFELAWEPAEEPVERARRTAIRAQMGFGSAGATKGKTGFRIDTKREYGTAQHLWSEYPDSIAAVGMRFTGVLIENRPALDVMKQHDAPSTLHFVDPPYLLSTRSMEKGRQYYRHELTDDEHVELLDTIKALSGCVVLSGYQSELYESSLRGWKKHTTDSRIAGQRGCKIRTECVWINEACAEALGTQEIQMGMFA
jgi:DNA adenine methylase